MGKRETEILAELIAEQTKNKLEQLEKDHNSGGCGDPNCKQKFDELHSDFYKDGGVRDRSLKSVCLQAFNDCKAASKSFATKKMFWIVFSGCALGIGSLLLTLIVGVANSADESDVANISREIAVIRTIIEKDSDFMKSSIQRLVDTDNARHAELSDRIKDNENRIDKCIDK